MRALTLVFVIGLAVATTADGALAQNTLLLGRGQPPRQSRRRQIGHSLEDIH